MEKALYVKKFKELATQICAWRQGFDKKSENRNFFDIITEVCLVSSKGIIISTGRNNLTAYIGPYYKCKKVLDNYPDNTYKFAPCGHHWYWIGYGDEKTINQLTLDHAGKANLRINCLEDDIVDLTKYLSYKLSYENYFGDEKVIVSYIGSRRTCRILKWQHNGRYDRIGHYWYWVGKCSFKDIQKAISKSRTARVYKIKKGLVDD